MKRVSNNRRFSVFAFIGIFASVFVLINSLAFAALVKTVEVRGKSVEFDISDITARMKGEHSETEIRSLAALVTERYLEKGYTGSHIEKAVFTDDGKLELFIHEAHVIGLEVSGAGDLEKKISKIIFPSYGETYNVYVLDERKKKAAMSSGISSVRIIPRYMESGHIFLEVKVKRKQGEFYGGILFDMFYGTSPYAGYLYPAGDLMLGISAEAGYREGEFKKAGVSLSCNVPLKSYMIFIRTSGSRLVEVWDSMAVDYIRSEISPEAGLLKILGMARFSVSVKENIITTRDYTEDKKTYYDTSVAAEVKISNRDFLLDQRDASSLNFNLSSGYSDIVNNGYVTADLRAGTSFELIPRFRIVPVADVYYTSIDERLYHEYVFDSMLPGFYDDYTASGFKNTFRLDAEIELIRGFLYAGPLVSSGYFLDEEEVWRFETGAGMKADFVFRNVTLNLIFAWDIKETPEEGGLFFSAAGSF